MSSTTTTVTHPDGTSISCTTTDATASTEPMTLHYWGAKSRGQGVAYTIGYFCPDAPITYATQIGFPGTPEFAEYESKSMLGQLPCLEHDGVKIGQSGAIVRYLARAMAIKPNASLADVAASEEVIEIACGDIMGMAGKAQYAPDRTAAMDELFDSAGTDKSKHLCVIFGILEAKIGDSGFFGSEAMIGDACAAANVGLMLDLQPDCLDKYPKLAALVKTFAENDGVKKHAANFQFPYFKRKSD